MPSPLPFPLSDRKFLVETIHEITGESTASIETRLRKEQRDLGCNVREALIAQEIPFYQWSNQLADFYRTTEAFFYESIVWNQTQEKCSMRAWISKFLHKHVERSARLLTFGDGIGIDSLFLSQCGYAVDYFEVSHKSQQFAQKFSQRAASPVHQLKSNSVIQQFAYDTVLCLDVLEHTPQPAAMVQQLMGYLRPGGLLFLSAPFWYIHPGVATHLAANRKYSGHLFRGEGDRRFRMAGGRFAWNPIVLQTESRQKNVSVSALNRLRVSSGGLLLRAGRYWSWPHTQVARQFVGRPYCRSLWQEKCN